MLSLLLGRTEFARCKRMLTRNAIRTEMAKTLKNAVMDYIIRYRLVSDGRMMHYRSKTGRWRSVDIGGILPSDVLQDLFERNRKVGPLNGRFCACGHPAYFSTDEYISLNCQSCVATWECCPNCSDSELYECDSLDHMVTDDFLDLKVVRCIDKRCPLCGFEV